jgi:hypothetical protein
LTETQYFPFYQNTKRHNVVPDCSDQSWNIILWMRPAFYIIQDVMPGIMKILPSAATWHFSGKELGATLHGPWASLTDIPCGCPWTRFDPGSI